MIKDSELNGIMHFLNVIYSEFYLEYHLDLLLSFPNI